MYVHISKGFGVHPRGPKTTDLETAAFQERLELTQNLIPPLLLPLNGWVVHLVDNHQQVLHTERFGEHGVLARLVLK